MHSLLGEVLAGRPGAAIAGAVVGVLLGFGIALGNRRLERVERLPVTRSRVQGWGPPALLGVALAVLGGQIGWHVVFGLRALWAAVLVQVLFFDLAHRLILDRVLLPAAVLAFLASFVTPGVGWESSLAAGVGAVAVFGAFAFLGRLALGVQGTVAALVLGVLLAGVVAAALLVARARSLRDTIAYGPFLCVGALLGLFLNGQAVR